MTRTIPAALAFAALLSTPGLAFAHAAITPTEAANGSTARVAIAIPHGCEGAATDKLSIAVPEGFVGAKPQAKAGWTIKVDQADYARPHEVHGKPITSGAVAITWSGGTIPDDQFDEFVLQGTVDTEEQNLVFVTTQWCGTTAVKWDQLPAEGQAAHDLEHPAPTLAVTAAAGGEHDHMMMGMDMDQPVKAGDLEITGAFTRATLPKAPVGGGYLTITNTGSMYDRLVSASSPIAGTTQIHEMKMDGATMKMNEVPDGVVIPAGGTVTLAPGGLHIMFMDLAKPLVEGTKVPVTLTFEKAGTVEVELSVGGIAAKEAPMSMQHGEIERPNWLAARAA